MTKVSDLYGGSFVKAEHLKGSEVEVEIESYSCEKFSDDGKTKLVLKFKGMKKRLGLNKTNAKSIGKAYGDEVDNWIGKNIVLFPTTTEFQGDTVDCIRIRVPSDSSENNEVTF